MAYGLEGTEVVDLELVGRLGRAHQHIVAADVEGVAADVRARDLLDRGFVALRYDSGVGAGEQQKCSAATQTEAAAARARKVKRHRPPPDGDETHTRRLCSEEAHAFRCAEEGGV